MDWPPVPVGFGHSVPLAALLEVLTVAVYMSLGSVLAKRSVGWRGVWIVGASLWGALYSARVVGSILFGFAPLRSNLWVDALLWRFRGDASIIGGIAGGLGLAAALAVVSRTPVVSTLSSLCPALALAQGIGRIRCLAVGCCFGLPTKMPWGVRFAPMTPAGFVVGPASLHPTQIYEGVGDCLLAVATFVLWKRNEPHRTLGVYLGGYGLIRFVVEFFRAATPDAILGLSVGQVASVLFALVGLFIGSSRKSVTLTGRSRPMDCPGGYNAGRS